MIKNKYYKIYRSICKIAKKRDLDVDTYYEKHHIVPSSLGGSNKPHNLVFLTAREHFICHSCLVRFLEGVHKRKMIYALNMMGQVEPTNDNRRYINSIIYEANKIKFSIEHSKNISEENHPAFGKYGKDNPKYGSKCSEEAIENFKNSWTEERKAELSKRASKYMQGNKLWLGKFHTEESKRKMSESSKGPKSEEHKRNLSISAKNRKRIKCPYCDKSGDASNMKRWHFDNCKLKDKKES